MKELKNILLTEGFNPLKNFIKKYIIPIFIILILFSSCGKDSDNNPGVVEETGKILSGYVDTLETSISNAKEVRNMLDNRYQKLAK